LFELFEGGAVFCLLLNSQETVAAEAVGIVGGDVLLFFVGQLDTGALALGDVADLTFEGGVTAAAGLCFVLTHRKYF